MGRARDDDFGEHMSFEMENKFRELVDIGELQPEFVLWAGSLEYAEKWDRLIHHLAEDAQFWAETGYKTEPLDDDLGLLSYHVIDTLSKMGVESPKAFPPELESYLKNEDSDDGNIEGDNFDDSDEVYEPLETNSYSVLIRAIFGSLNDVWGFYAAYVANISDDENEAIFDIKENIEACLIDLAACKIQIDKKFAPRIDTFRREVIKEYQEWLTALKEEAFRAGIPLRAELLDMVSDKHGELGHAAEAEALGFNASRLHPDIYMNELLVGMRIIHQVLPIILKKLDISESEFVLDESNLHINMNPTLAY